MSFDLKIQGGDLVINQGKLKQVTDSEKLIQDILKMCITTAGSNPIHPWYGSLLSQSIVGNPNYNSVLVQIAKSHLNTALENIKTLQEMQIKSYQTVTSDEQLGAILDISVIRNNLDPRLYDVKISVISKGSKPITTSFKVSTI